MGDTRTPISGIGHVRFNSFSEPFKEVSFDLKECLYIPRFHVNIISAQKAKKAGIFLNSRKNCLENQASQPICGINDDDGITYVRWNKQPLIPPRLAMPSMSSMLAQPSEKTAFSTSADPLITKGTSDLWHQRLGHPSKEAIQHLQDVSTGIEVEKSDDQTSSQPCETCQVSKAKRQISRRPISIGDKPFETMHWDLIYISTRINASAYISHAYCPVTKYHISANLAKKHQIEASIQAMLQFLRTQFSIYTKRIHADGDRNLLAFISTQCQQEGIEMITSPPYHLEQNPYAERSGAIIIIRARAMLH